LDSSEGRELNKLDDDRTSEIEKLGNAQQVSDSLFREGELRTQLNAANKRIDELVIIIHNMAQQMSSHGYNMIGTGYDMQTLGRVILDRFPLTGMQQEIVNKSKQQQEQSVNNQ
jgi:phosphomevalonate kinase